MVLKPRESYRLDKQGGFLVVVALEASYCPVCQTILLMRATRKRVCWEGDTETDKAILVIRRLYCEACERIHHELPDCLVPYKRYSAEVIDNIVNGQTTKVIPCPDGTARRLRGWWQTVKPYFLGILMTLVAKFNVRFGEPPAFNEIVRAVANSNNWVFAHQVCTRSESRPG